MDRRFPEAKLLQKPVTRVVLPCLEHLHSVLFTETWHMELRFIQMSRFLVLRFFSRSFNCHV